MFEPTKISPRKSPFATVVGPERPRWVLPTAVAVVAAIVIVAGWTMWDRGPSTANLLTQRVTIGNVEDAVTALGTLQPLQYVDVGTQVSGQLKVLHVDYGAAVKKGDLLAEIDPTIYESRVNADEAQLLNLRAQLAQRQAQKALADLQFKRQQELLKENATSQDAYDSADANLKVAIATIRQLEAQIKQTESTLSGDKANLSYTKIYATMDGTVVNLIAKEGQTLNANQTAPLVLRIADLATMTVWAQVSEADVPKLRVGMNAYFTTLGTSERRRYGKLRQIIPTPEVVNNVVLYNCLFDVPNPDGDLLTQMSAQVFFVMGSARQVPIVPVAALHPVRTPRQDEAQGSDAPPEDPPSGTIPPASSTSPSNAPADGQASGTQPDAQSGGRRARGPRNSAVPSTRYTVRVLEDGKIVTRDVEIGVMNRLSAEVKSGLKPDEEVVLDGGPQQQRSGQQRQQGGPPGGFGGRGGGGGGPRI
jgi:macrolide-specific efflux system membrane fusion protein